jgi:hypothetical protein
MAKSQISPVKLAKSGIIILFDENKNTIINGKQLKERGIAAVRCVFRSVTRRLAKFFWNIVQK